MVNQSLHQQNCNRVIICFCWLLLSVTPFAAAGQVFPENHNVDSILYQLQKGRPDTTTGRLLQELSADYLSKTVLNATELARAKSVFMALVKWAHNTGDKELEARGWIGYADALMQTKDITPFISSIETACKNAMNIYAEMKDARGEIDAELRLAAAYYRMRALSKLEWQLLAMLPKSKAAGLYQLARIYSVLSLENRYSGSYNKALGYALHAVKAVEDSKDSARADIYYGELAEVYQALGKPAESISWYKKCLAKREALPGYGTFFLYRTYSLLIVQLIKAGAQKEAMATIQNLQRRRPPVTQGERAVLFQCMAYCYDAGKDYDSAGKYFLKMVEGFNEAGKEAVIPAEIVLLSYYDIAEFYVRRGQFEKARPYLEMIMLDRHSVKVSKVADVQLLLFKIDSAGGSYQAAIRHIQQYKMLSDSVVNEIKNREIEQLQIEYNSEKKDQEIKQLKKREQLQQANLRQANIIRNWIAASAVLLMLLLIAGYTRYRFKQKTNKKLEEQRVVIHQKNASLQRLVNEKEWLIKEIHHRVKNNFHIVTGLLGTQSGYLKSEEAIAAVKESRQRIHAMSLIHLKLFQSENLLSVDVREYIYELVDSLKESFDQSAAIQFHVQADRMHLELSHVMPVGLILNEAITNVFKHAFPDKKPGNVYISFVCNDADKSMVLTVRDDGTGLPADFGNNSQPSMGLNLMRGLSADIDGHFTMESDNGTIVRLSFIYNPDPDAVPL